MFAHIRRHQKWLWIFISGAVIISFVWYFNPNQQMQGAGGDARSTVGTIYGDPITLSQYQDARREAALHIFLSYGTWPDEDQFTRETNPLNRETRTRLLLIRKLKDLNIEVNDGAVTDWIKNTFQDRETKQFHYEFVDRFFQNIKTKGLREADFERYVRHQVGITHLAAIAGTPGKLVTPQEVERALLEEREKVDTKVALLPMSNYVAKVNITPEVIGTYYSNSVARYRLPERVQLAYVAFPLSNYFAQADQKMSSETNLNQQIDQIYLQRGPQFFTDPAGQPLTPEAAKQRIKDEIRKEFASNDALKAAYDFAKQMEDVKINPANPNPAEPLENQAASKGYTVQLTQPFSAFAGPTELQLPDDFNQVAFQLSPESPILQEPVAGEEAVYVFGFKRKIPSEVQPLEVVRESVTEDYRRSEGFKLAREAANAFITAATNALASGGQLETVAQQNGLTVVDLQPVLREGREPITNLPPMVDAGALRSAIFDLNAGQLSSYTPSREGGFVALVEKIIPPTQEEIQQEYGTFLQEYRRRTAVLAFNDWLTREMQAARMTIAGDDEQEAAQ